MDLTATARDTAYVVIGFGVLGFQKAQVLRREVLENLASERERLRQAAPVDEARSTVESQVSEVKVQLARVLDQVDTAFEPARRQIDDRLEDLQQRLPQAFGGVLEQARAAAAAARDQVRSLVDA